MKPKLGGAAPVVAVTSSTQTQAAAVGNPAADLGFKVAISEEEKIQRLQKRVAELMHQMQALQSVLGEQGEGSVPEASEASPAPARREAKGQA